MNRRARRPGRSGPPGRGRPLRLPDEGRASSPRGRSNARIAWLLTTNRLLGPDPEFARRGPFLAALEERGVKVDPSTLSRWETGAVDVPDDAVNRYEEVLGLPSGVLVAANSGVRRVFGVRRTPRRRDPRDPALIDLDLEPLVGRLLGGSGTGGDWLALTRAFHEFDLVRLPSAVWARLCTQLVEELGTAAGHALLRRFEAAQDLLHRAEASGHLRAAVAAYLRSPHPQSVFAVLAVLSGVDDEPVGQLATEMLDAESPVVRMSTAWTLSVKLARRHRAGLSIARLEEYVRHGLRYGESVSDRLEAANLAVHLPVSSWTRVVRGLRLGPTVQLVHAARARGELLLRPDTRGVIHDLVSTTFAETDTEGTLAKDPMLSRLVFEAVTHVDSARRFRAMLTLSTSPYAAALARHARELAHSEFPVLATRMQELLFLLSDLAPRETAVEQALEEDRETLRARALMSLGAQPAGLAPAPEAAIVAHTLWSTTPMDRVAGLFALGMAGSPSVSTLAEHQELGAAARWWLGHGPATRDDDLRGAPEQVRTNSK